MATKSNSYRDRRTGETVKQIDWNKLNSQIKQNSQKKQAERASNAAKWEQERKAREAEKQTESYKRQAALAERRRKSENLKIEQATAEFNKKADAQAKGREASQAAQARRESNAPKPMRQEIPRLKEKYAAVNKPYDANPNYSNYGYAYQVERLTDEGKLQKWSDPNYKLSKSEKKEAKNLLKQEQKRRNELIKSGNQDIMLQGTAENDRYQKAMDLDAKVNNAFGYGLYTPFLKAAGLAQKGIEKLVDPKDGGDVSRAFAMQNEQLNKAYDRNDMAAMQSPIKNTLGNLTGQGLMYSATNPIFDAGAEALGATSTAGKIIANQLGQNAQDLVLDTLPTYLQNLERGMTEEQAKSEALKGVKENAAGNLLFQGIGEVAKKVIPSLKATNAPKIDMDEFRRGITRLEDINNGDIGVARKSSEQIAKETKQIENQIGQMARGELGSDKYIELGETPEYMKEYGDISNPLVMSQSNSFKMAYPEGYEGGKHNTGFRAIAELPKRTDNPIAVMKSNTQPKSGLVVTDMIDANGNPVSLPIHMDKKSDMGLINEVASMQGRNNTENLINNSDILYKNEKRIRSALSGEGLQLPELKADSDPFLNGRIPKLGDNVKSLSDLEDAFETVPENTGLRQAANVYNAEAIEDAIGTNDWIRSVVSDAVAKNEGNMTDTARKNLARLNTALDNLDDAIRQGGDLSTIQELNKEVERAYGALDKNFQRFGSNDLRQKGKSGSSFFGGNSQFNVNNILDKGRPSVDLPADANGYIDMDAWAKSNPEEAAELEEMFSVMPDADGLRRRQGVDVRTDIRDTANMRADYGDTLTAEQRLSNVRGVTLERAGIDNSDELSSIIPEQDFMYWTQPEKQTYEAAQASLDRDWDGNLAKYTADYDKDNVQNIRNAQDIDAMMLMRSKLNQAAREATDPAEKRRLYQESRKVALNLRKAGTEAGREVQAFAKWTRTPEGAVTSAQGFAEDLVEKGLKAEPKLANEIKETSEEIENFLDEMDAAALTREQIEDMIKDAVNRRSRLRQRVGNGDIQKITDAILNDRQWVDIQKQLEFLSTGFQDVDAETLDAVQDIFERAQELNFNSKERVDLENEAYKLLADKIAPNGGSLRDKIDAWRYLAMLANPTTHIKNMTGNELFGGVMVSTKNTLGAMIEEAADRVSKVAGGNGIERTKAILTPADKGLVDAARKDALENAYRELSGNKYYGTGEGIDKAISDFSMKTRRGRFLNRASDINGGLLNKEDEIAVLAKYRTSLAGFLKANGADASIFDATDEASQKLLESGRAYAINQAKEAAFHQDSAVANALSQFTSNARNSDSKALKALGMGVDVAVPFKKTPINVLKSAIEYSPVQFVKVASDIRKLNRGVIKPADFIDDISKGITGSAALGIGAMLAHEGVLKIGSDKTNEEKSFDTQTGRQNVAIKTGNRYVGLSELIPAAAPFIFGATIYETMANDKGGDNALNVIFSGLSAIANGVTDMTMLSGIADTLNSVRYADDDASTWQNLGLNMLNNFSGQMLPTLGRKANVTADPVKRSTYSDKTGALKTIDQNTKYLQTKIPGLQQLGENLQGSEIPQLQAIGDRFALEPNIDVKGQVQDSPGMFGNNNLISRFANNFLSPVSTTTDRSDEYDDERRRLANATGEMKVLPYIASSEANIDGARLSPSDWTDYRMQRGQMREELAKAAMDSDYYKNMSDADKAEMLKTLDSFSKAYSQEGYGKEISSENAKMADIYDANGSKGVLDYMSYKSRLKDMGTSAQGAKLEAVRDFPEEVQEWLLPEAITTKGEQQRWEESGQDVKKYWKSYNAAQTEALQKADAKQKKQEAKDKERRMAAAKVNMSAESLDNVQSQLASLGAIDSSTTVDYYMHAKETIPSLTPQQYAGYLHDIGGDDYKITQKEMISYANNNNLSEATMNQYWNAFGQWKKIPVLVNGTWKTKGG